MTQLATVTQAQVPPSLAKQEKSVSALSILASRLQADPTKLLDTLRATCFKGATAEELLALVVVSNVYQLNPLIKEIYAFPAKGGGITPVVSIDGWIRMMNRQEAFDGLEFSYANDDAGTIESCTCSIFLKGRSRPIKVSEYLTECTRGTEPWKQMPRRMIRHKALIQCARIAFGFGGVYDEEEAEAFSSAPIENGKKLNNRLAMIESGATTAEAVIAELPAAVTPTIPSPAPAAPTPAPRGRPRTQPAAQVALTVPEQPPEANPDADGEQSFVKADAWLRDKPTDELRFWLAEKSQVEPIAHKKAMDISRVKDIAKASEEDLRTVAFNLKAALILAGVEK